MTMGTMRTRTTIDGTAAAFSPDESRCCRCRVEIAHWTGSTRVRFPNGIRVLVGQDLSFQINGVATRH